MFSDSATALRSTFYTALKRRDPGMHKHLWCPIRGKWVFESEAVAAHIFAHMHGQAVMDSIFGKIRPAELYSLQNGLVMSRRIEEMFDAGFMAIVQGSQITHHQLKYHSGDVRAKGVSSPLDRPR
jgi:hypothetical protein